MYTMEYDSFTLGKDGTLTHVTEGVLGVVQDGIFRPREKDFTMAMLVQIAELLCIDRKGSTK